MTPWPPPRSAPRRSRPSRCARLSFLDSSTQLSQPGVRSGPAKLPSMNVRGLINPSSQRQRRYQTIASLLKLGPNETVLSVGCGEGNSFEAFNTTNPICGLDIFEESPITLSDRFTYVHRTGDDFPFSDRQFDAVVCIGVLEHIFPTSTLIKTAAE